MNILVTNDDGIFAPGVEALTQVLQHFGNVYVVCPDQEKSAVGHANTLRTPLKLTPVDLFPGSKGVWSVNGTPADCVKLGVEVLLKEKPDILFSGINLGPNLGRDIYYSGTMAGAVEASLYHVPAVAVSLQAFKEKKVNYTRVKQLFYHVAEMILQHTIPQGIFLNINLPDLPKDLCKGVEVVPLDMTVSRYRYVGLNDPYGQVYYWLTDHLIQLTEFNRDSDYLKLKEGYITVTPVSVDHQFNNRRKIEQIRKWFKPLSFQTSSSVREESHHA
ncbi:5'-nucleotidase [Caldalkalibacillus uzonensis]|uniref:5'-nucleotidase SurE n=1 Tax=Caldalkalibacillus uzonensis TaxID=353224 RepID=A0ABU0CW99_9BACI|nr:5'/3'-nucleotidase SurE [Caldalkalibacillus uzonensis]MDQ0340686.1 5'-nucleotidase [Caldalkalibacillus uzonensis]